MRHLLPFHAAYIERATFFCLATGRADGLDASPRGGSPGFVRVIDARTVAFADWPGNNRIESMRNLKEDARAALLFIFPGLEIFLRINGHAGVSTDAGLLGLLAESGKTPKTAITVHIDEVLFHCGKAVNRAKLWEPESIVDRQSVPSIGQLKTAMTGGDENEARLVDAEYAKGVRTGLY
jgi:PPOX class probable FMN-dependent enzyme